MATLLRAHESTYDDEHAIDNPRDQRHWDATTQQNQTRQTGSWPRTATQAPRGNRPARSSRYPPDQGAPPCSSSSSVA